MEHVLDADPVDVVVGHVFDRGGRLGQLAHATRQVVDGDALLGADVVDLSRRAVIHEPGERADRVRHMAEATRLISVAMDLQRLLGKGPLDERRDDHPVLAALAWADRVEQADDDAVEVVLGVVREREELVHRFRVRIRPALLRRRPVDPPVGLDERPLLAVVAVDLGGRGDQDALAEPVTVLEDDLGATQVRHERLHGLLDDQTDTHRRGEVVDHVAFVDELVDDRPVEYGVHDEMKSVTIPEVLDVVERSGRKIVEHPYLVSFVEQQLREVRTDEPGAARD